MKLVPKKDPIGQAIADYYNTEFASDIVVQLDIKDEIEGLDPAYFFRKEEELPLLEKKALSLVTGTCLDVGAGAGCHSKILQEKGIEVTACEISELSCNIMKKDGIKNVINNSVFELSSNTKYDTLILLMNGLGVVETGNKLKEKLPILINLLNPGGQILFDSTDLIYMFDEEDRSQAKIELVDDDYYGDTIFNLSYENTIGDPFPWTYLDPDLVKKVCNELGYKFDIITKGENFDYLARISK